METQVLGEPRGINAGGLAQLWLIPIDQVKAVLDPYFIEEAEPFTVPAFGLPLTEDAEITRINFPTGGASFEENKLIVEEGSVYALELEAFIPRNETTLLDYLHRNQERRFLSIFTDRNGLTYLTGEPEQGLLLTVTRSIAGTNSVKLSLSGRSWHPAFMLEDADFDTLLPYSFAAYEFNQSLYL